MTRLILLFFLLLFYFFSLSAKTYNQADTVLQNNHFRLYYKYRESNPIKALDQLQQALEIAQSLDMETQMGILNFQKGYVYRRLGIFNLATTSYLNSLTLFEKLQDPNLIAWSLLEIGNLYRDQKNNAALSQHYFERAEKLFKSKNIKIGLIVVNYCLGELFQNNKNYDAAIVHYYIARQISHETKDMAQEAIALSYLGDVFLLKKDIKKSKFFFNALIDLSKKSKNSDGIARAYMGLARMSGFLGKKEESIGYYLKGLESYQEIHDQLNIAQTLEKISEVYFGQGDLRKAIQYAEQALEVADSNAIFNQQQLILKKLADYYTLINDPVKSNQSLKKYIELKESEINKNAQIIQKEYELQLLKKDGLMKEQMIKKQRTTIYLSIISSAFFLLLLVVIVIKNRKLKESYQHLFSNGLELNKKKQELIEIKRDAKYIGSTLKDNQQESLVIEFTHLLNNEQIFLQKDITLESLAKQMNTNRTYLSQIINDHFNNSFSNLINEYRVRKAQEMMLDPSSKVYTLEAIAQKVGFNSKSNFNLVFKKITGLTPSIFISLNESKGEIPDL
jgi:YesN/AraC family two-component response regulator